MPVTITITGEHARQALDELNTMAGGLSPRQLIITTPVSDLSSDTPRTAVVENEPGSPLQSSAEQAPKRGRKPKAAAPTFEGEVTSKPVEKLPEGPALNIRANPEQREPEQTDIEEAVKAQDEADEQPEAPQGPKVYTVDDVRNSAVKYRDKFGVAEVQEDLVKLLTEKAGVAKISALQSTSAEDLQAICFAIEVAIDSGKRYGA